MLTLDKLTDIAVFLKVRQSINNIDLRKVVENLGRRLSVFYMGNVIHGNELLQESIRKSNVPLT